MSKQLGSVRYVHPKTGKVLFRDKMPMKELKKLVPDDEYEKERLRRYHERKRYRERNADKIREKKRQYREENREKVLASKREYYQNNKDALAKGAAKWRKENPDKVREIRKKKEHKRKAALNNCLPTDSSFLNSHMKSEQICPITGSTSVDLEHIFPVSKGWLGNNRGNLMWLQSNINSSKGNKNVFTWLSELTQQNLDYLMREESSSISLQQFKTRYKEALTKQAELLGMSFSEYKTEYNKHYN